MRRSAGEMDKLRSSVWRLCAFMRASQSQWVTWEQKLNFRGQQMGRFVPAVCKLSDIQLKLKHRFSVFENTDEMNFFLKTTML